jgi:hypothetical protein
MLFTCFADITEGLYSRVKFFCVVLAEVFNLFAFIRKYIEKSKVTIMQQYAYIN